jgi:hypothetical protein
MRRASSLVMRLAAERVPSCANPSAEVLPRTLGAEARLTGQEHGGLWRTVSLANIRACTVQRLQYARGSALRARGGFGRAFFMSFYCDVRH